jgi:hypothetical protein
MNDFRRLPDAGQREALYRMMALAFVEIRALGWAGRGDQAADLADALHNLPTEMHGLGRWDEGYYRGCLRYYQDKYQRGGGGTHDWVAMFDAIFLPREREAGDRR